MKQSIVILFFFFCCILFGQSIDYENEIQPIFNNSCIPCHSGNNPSGGLDLTSYENVMAGNNDGSVVDIGDYENSILWQEVSSGDMPNNIANNNMGILDLTDEEIQLIADWILDLQCMVIDCMPEYTCILGECVCINDADSDGICDEFENETMINEGNHQKNIIKTIDLLGKESIKTDKKTLIHIYDDGSTQKINYIN